MFNVDTESVLLSVVSSNVSSKKFREVNWNRPIPKPNPESFTYWTRFTARSYQPSIGLIDRFSRANAVPARTPYWTPPERFRKAGWSGVFPAQSVHN